MTYTQIGALAVLIAITLDLGILRTNILKKGVWWLSYSIVITFQFLTNGVLTGFAIVQYDPEFNLGSSFYDSQPPLIGDGRIFFAPAEDLMFGFAMCLSVVSIWIFLGRSGIQQYPISKTSEEIRQKFKFLG
jgi:hypothetical protein